MVGGLAFAVDFLSFVFLHTVLNQAIIVATVISVIMGFLTSFILNKVWVFKSNSNNSHHSTHLQISMYILLVLFNMAFSYIFIQIMSNYLNRVEIAKLGAMITIVLWNYFLYKKVIFKTNG